MIKSKFLFLLFCVSTLCEAADLKPWFGNQYETEIRVIVLYQNYHSLAIPHKNRLVPLLDRDDDDRHRFFDRHNFYDLKRNENVFGTLSASYAFKKYCGEFEVTAAHTHHQNYRIDNFRFTGRYQWLNDEEGDVISFVTGLTVCQPLSRALHDISSFHHGHIEGEATLAIGKEYGFSSEESYIWRWWNVLGVGIADIGKPWIREDFACEYNFEDNHQLRGFLYALWGTGNENIRKYCFNGYGFIKHRSVDVGLRYSFSLDCWGTLSIQYARRVYALNFPENTNLALIEYYLPFGTQFTCSY